MLRRRTCLKPTCPMLVLCLSVLMILLPLVGQARAITTPTVMQANSSNSVSKSIFYWNFNNGDATGWIPIIGWNSETQQPQYPIACKVVNGQYSLTTCESLYRLHNFTDLIFSAQVKVVQAATEPIWGIGFRINPASPAYASIVAVTGDPYTLAQGYFFEFVGSSAYLYSCQATCTALASASPNVNPFATNILTIVAAGSSITGFVNGVQVISVTDSTFSQGRISLFSIPNGCSASGCSAVTSNFDNVVAIST